jgi:hypothetical protein
LALAAVGLARAQELAPQPNESDLAFAVRALRLPPADAPHVTVAEWNGVRTLFVDYKTKGSDPQTAERPIVALLRQPSGGYRAVDVTLGEQEGGTPDLVALGFANAGSDPGKELIVILGWPVRHYDVDGTMYQVRLFDAPKLGQTALTPLSVTRRFGAGCECSWRTGASKRYRFKSVDAVKAELRRLGY